MKLLKILAAGTVAGVLLLSATSLQAQNNTSETYRQLNLFGEVFERDRKSTRLNSSH